MTSALPPVLPGTPPTVAATDVLPALASAPPQAAPPLSPSSSPPPPSQLPPSPQAALHPWHAFWQAYRQNTGAVIGLVFLVLVTLLALFAPWLAPHDPVLQARAHFLQPPVFAGGNTTFLLGTDELGRDLLSRLMHGARLSLLVGIVSVGMAMVPGVLLGLLAAFATPMLDAAIMRLMDIMMALPALLLAVAIIAILSPGLVNAMIAIALVSLPAYVRLTRAAAMAERTRDYVTAAQLSGAGRLRLMLVTVLPNCMAPLIVLATMSFSAAILEISALGFLGLGVQPPLPEWGTMLASARDYIERAWWVVTFPGLAILLTVLAINLIGDGLRDALDPKLKTAA